MSNSQPFRWRTVLEVGVISAVIYVLLGAPGLPSINTNSTAEQNVPIARAKVENIVYQEPGLQCSDHHYDIRIFSQTPLVILIDNFISEREANHLIAISHEKWQTSTVFNNGVETVDEAVRKSEKAMIDRDTTVQCIESRALAIQGWPKDTFIERLWTQRYNTTGHYDYHYDWATASKTSRRQSTFMVYLQADCEGGGTNFPKLERPTDARWCDFIECDGKDEGVTFKARKGAAVFWSNFDADGRGYQETIHAGMPVRSGTKIGLNIWTWFLAGHKRPEEGGE
ncbi:prolyl 4-hydroxylase subunit alpha-3-like [Teratosphaeria destructans]|uniref:Prolyl 4-hydroxylase subunit alpha-3-like n=1 Tax=Teratosphaeria destructans TaxID=418781 RepID=A0A9W7W3T8_9PEZI|nr:prolyl 4-hydroxylase subunit alpha-3-like [Teratosphaeria destructans]